MQRDHPVAGIADIILLGPAGGTGPSSAQDALPQFRVGKRAVAEVTGKPRKARRIFIRAIPLLPDARDVLPDAGYKILLLRPLLRTTW